MRTTVRLFAAAREAVGSAELVIQLEEPARVGDALRAADPGDAASVLERCSVLVDGVAAERDEPLSDGAVLDVLPPFAGG